MEVCAVGERQHPTRFPRPAFPPDEKNPAAAGFVERMTRCELATSTLARWRSSQLSYIRVRGER
jgi:hypothetical protein